MLNDANKVSPLHKYYRYDRVGGVCGIEVEVEFLRLNRNPPDEVLTVWYAHADGSLRHHGVEYTMFKPMTGFAKNKAVVDLCGFINAQPFVPGSPRTSVHTHINVQKRPPLHIWNAIVLYWILEPVLMQHCGEERIGNPFCLRLLDALALVDTSCQDLLSDTPFKMFRGNDDIRYAGLNLQPLRSFGSLEFRGMRGEYDSKLINEWSDFLVKLVHSVASWWPHPAAILDEVYNSNREAFFQKIMGDYYDSIGKPYFNKSVDDIEEGIEALLPLAYFHDWEKWQAKMESNLVKNKDKGGNAPQPNRIHFDAMDMNAAVQVLRRNDAVPQMNWRVAQAPVNLDDFDDIQPLPINPIRR